MRSEYGSGNRGLWGGGAELVVVAALIAVILVTIGSGALARVTAASANPQPPPPNALPVRGEGGCIPPSTYRTSRTFNLSGQLIRVGISVTIVKAASGFWVRANVTLAPVGGGAAEIMFTPPLADMAVKTDLGTYVWSHGKLFIQVVLRRRLPVSTHLSMRVNGSCVEGIALYIRPLHRYVVLGGPLVTGELVETLSKTAGTTTATAIAGRTRTRACNTLVILIMYSRNGGIRVLKGLGRLASVSGGRISVTVCINGTCSRSTLSSSGNITSVKGVLADMIKKVIEGRVLAVTILRPDTLRALPQLLSAVEKGFNNRMISEGAINRPTTASTPSGKPEVSAAVTKPRPTSVTSTGTTAATVETVTTVPTTTTLPTTTPVRSVPTVVTPTSQHAASTAPSTTSTTPTQTAGTRHPVFRGESIEWLATAVAAAIAVAVGITAYLVLGRRP